VSLQAAPDGYTLLAGSMGSHVAAPVLTPNIKYDLRISRRSDRPPIHRQSSSPGRISAKDPREFVAHLKLNGSAVKQAHGGIGASSHMACLLFTSEIGVKPTLVAYRGSNLGMNDMIGGHVDFLCEQSVSVSKHVTGGAIKAYGISAAERLAALPDVPTAKEAGINYQMSIWAGICAAGTPQPVVASSATRRQGSTTPVRCASAISAARSPTSGQPGLRPTSAEVTLSADPERVAAVEAA
jgi:tripartite-type tricarboxylate transporter receptor subunit TctC